MKETKPTSSTSKVGGTTRSFSFTLLARELRTHKVDQEQQQNLKRPLLTSPTPSSLFLVFPSSRFSQPPPRLKHTSRRTKDRLHGRKDVGITIEQPTHALFKPRLSSLAASPNRPPMHDLPGPLERGGYCRLWVRGELYVLGGGALEGRCCRCLFLFSCLPLPFFVRFLFL
jgi:hypothetical protein